MSVLSLRRTPDRGLNIRTYDHPNLNTLEQLWGGSVETSRAKLSFRDQVVLQELNRTDVNIRVYSFLQSFV